jgi:hypothetical protein
LETLAQLLAGPLNLDAGENDGMTALMYAASYEDAVEDDGAKALAMVQLLIDKGASVETARSHGQSAALLAATKLNASVIELLIQHGAQLHVDVLAEDTIRVSSVGPAFGDRASLQLMMGPRVFRGEYKSGASSSAWVRAVSPRAVRTFSLLKSLAR